jgi:hypothetical protein
MSFNTIILLNCETGLIESLKQDLKIDQNLYVFNVGLSDELQQIANQSTKSLIIMDKMQSLAVLYNSNVLKLSNKPIKYIFFDGSFLLRDVDIEYLKRNNIFILQPALIKNLISTIELYFYGKIQSLGQLTSVPPTQDSAKQSTYITMMKINNDKFQIHASSHLRHPNINKIIGFDVEELLDDISNNFIKFNAVTEVELTNSEFIQIIYPICKNNSPIKIALIHLKKTDEYIENKNKIINLFENWAKN